VNNLLHSRLAFWTALVFIIFFAVVQASARLNNNLTIDEPYTANLIHLPLPQIWEEFQRVGYKVPYHLLLKGWSAIFGESEAALRAFSLLCYCLTILAVGLTGKKILGIRGGLIAAFLLSISTQIGLVHAVNARPYALLGLQAALATLVCYYLIHLIPQHPRPGQTPLAILLTLLHLLGLMNHPIYIFYMAATCIAGLFVSRRIFGLLVLCAGVALGADFLLWGAAMQLSGFSSVNWMQAPDLPALLDSLLGLWGTENTLLLLGYIVALGFLRFCLSRTITISKLILVNTMLVISVVLLIFVVSQFRPLFNPDRAPMLYLPAASLLAAAIVSRLGFRNLSFGILAILAINSAVYSLHISERPNPSPTQASLEYVLSRAQCGDTLILGSLSFSVVEYYLRRLDAPDCIRRESFPLSTENHPGWMDTDLLLKQTDQLAEEAAATTSRLATQPGTTLWLFDINGPGDYRDITGYLKSQLDRQFYLVETLELRGLYFNSVFVYAVPQEVTEP
jgi:hypothetical protein